MSEIIIFVDGEPQILQTPLKIMKARAKGLNIMIRQFHTMPFELFAVGVDSISVEDGIINVDYTEGDKGIRATVDYIDEIIEITSSSRVFPPMVDAFFIN